MTLVSLDQAKQNIGQFTSDLEYTRQNSELTSKQRGSKVQGIKNKILKWNYYISTMEENDNREFNYLLGGWKESKLPRKFSGGGGARLGAGRPKIYSDLERLEKKRESSRKTHLKKNIK
jgi:hypothetical protein